MEFCVCAVCRMQEKRALEKEKKISTPAYPSIPSSQSLPLPLSVSLRNDYVSVCLSVCAGKTNLSLSQPLWMQTWKSNIGLLRETIDYLPASTYTHLENPQHRIQKPFNSWSGAET